MDEINEAAAALAALSVANMAEQGTSTPFIDQMATGGTPASAGIDLAAAVGESVPNVTPESPATDASATLSDVPGQSIENASSVKPSESLPMETPAPALPIDSAEPSTTIPISSAGSDLPNVLPASTSGTPLESTPSADSVDMAQQANLAAQQSVGSALEGDDAPNAVASVADAISASGTLSPAPSASPAAEPVLHPAHAFADQIHSLAFALEGSADSMIGRMGYEIRTLAASIKAIL